MSSTPSTEYRTYQLHIVVSREVRVAVGRLGMQRFPAGRYVYTGSARRNMPARVRRHLAKNKKLRWHIDYLLCSPQARVVHVAYSTEPECDCNRRLAGTTPVPGFGASDCRNGCGSHLKYVGPK